MKIKIIDCGSCPYITLGKVYDVIAKNDKRVGWWDIIDDEGDTYTVETLDDPENIVAVEVVDNDPMPVVEPVNDLECDRIEDNLNWLEGLANGSPDQPTEGGPAEYYDFKPNWVTLNDMNDYKAQHQWGPLSFHMGNISKATYRFGEKGNTSKVYDINKIIYSGLRCKLMLEDKKAVRKYLQQLLDDPQF